MGVSGLSLAGSGVQGGGHSPPGQQPDLGQAASQAQLPPGLGTGTTEHGLCQQWEPLHPSLQASRQPPRARPDPAASPRLWVPPPAGFPLPPLPFRAAWAPLKEISCFPQLQPAGFSWRPRQLHAPPPGTPQHSSLQRGGGRRRSQAAHAHRGAWRHGASTVLKTQHLALPPDLSPLHPALPGPAHRVRSACHAASMSE